MPYPESRLYAQDRYDQAARDNVHSRNGDKRLKKRQEVWVRKLKEGPLDEPRVRDFRALKHGYAVLLKQRENRRNENLNAARADLQQRHNEEVAFMSEARSEDGRPYNLPEEMCIKIADNNNKPAKWDKDLIRTTSTKNEKADVDYKTQTDISKGHQSVQKRLDELRLSPRHLQR